MADALLLAAQTERSTSRTPYLAALARGQSASVSKEWEVLKFSRRTTIIASTMALIVATSVIAYAVWTNSGTGSGGGSTGSNTVTVNQLSSVSGLVLDGPAATLYGDFTNPNAFSVHVNNVHASIDTVYGGPENTGEPCSAADFELNPASTAVNADIPPGASGQLWSGIQIRLKNDPARNQDNCKNAYFTIKYTTD